MLKEPNVQICILQFDMEITMEISSLVSAVHRTAFAEQDRFKRLSATLIRCIVLIYGRTMQIQVAHQLKSGNNTQCAHPDKHHNFISQPHYIQVSSLALAHIQPLCTDFRVCWGINWHIVLRKRGVSDQTYLTSGSLIKTIRNRHICFKSTEILYQVPLPQPKL